MQKIRKRSPMADQKGNHSSVSNSEKDVKSPNLVGGAKEGIKGLMHNDKSPRHDKETHGTSEDINESTPADEVKGPSVFERVKEEIEAVVEAVVHPKK